ncbi:MAG TPA: hypothetical protein VGQ68_09770 [Gaiellaceae bacterium]|jgi:hypothetical protein|nr:hypothetical protein [Gaiellaceae bacterium]
MLRLLRYLGLGALIAYFFDPDNGRRRRALARDRVPAFMRRGSERAEQLAHAASARASGVKQKVKQRGQEEPQPDDVPLTPTAP